MKYITWKNEIHICLPSVVFNNKFSLGKSQVLHTLSATYNNYCNQV